MVGLQPPSPSLLERFLPSFHYWKGPPSFSLPCPTHPLNRSLLLDLRFQERIRILNSGWEWMLPADLARLPVAASSPWFLPHFDVKPRESGHLPLKGPGQSRPALSVRPCARPDRGTKRPLVSRKRWRGRHSGCSVMAWIILTCLRIKTCMHAPTQHIAPLPAPP